MCFSVISQVTTESRDASLPASIPPVLLTTAEVRCGLGYQERILCNSPLKRRCCSVADEKADRRCLRLSLSQARHMPQGKPGHSQ
jgi:hypothetical protein